MESNRPRIGLFGGSFDPIHNRHISIAEKAINQFDLDKIIFIPTNNPPHKSCLYAPFLDRIIMLKIALCHNKKFEVSDIEFAREGYAYTYDTIIELKKIYKNADFYYIIGEDSLNYLDQWYRADDLFQLTNFIVCERFSGLKDRRKEIAKKGAKLFFLDIKGVNISSTTIRYELEKNRVSPNIPIVVLEYIIDNNLYNTREMPNCISKYVSILYGLLSIKRFTHSLGVAFTARQLAIIHNEDPVKITIAALLHDCAKNLSIDNMETIANRSNISLKSNFSNSDLMHAPIGAIIAKNTFGVSDNNILSAIEFHTTGNVNMNKFDKIIYLADKIEPGRSYYHGLDNIRKMAKKDLDRAMILCIESTSAYLSKQNKAIHKDTLQLLVKLKNKGVIYGS